jgi:peptidoglycan hydrolase-like protein with peptidoglycan-binding domain
MNADIPPSRPPRRAGRWLAGTVVVALAAGATVAVLRHRAAADAPGPQPSATVATVRLERRDLSTTTSLPGTIGYGAARPLAGHSEATVTWLPAVGSTIKRGQQLYRADDRPVPLFYGGLPLFRAIAGPNLVGRDVRLVADNLRALGYSIGRRPSTGQQVGQATVRDGDGVLTTGLAAAIRHWQKDTGLPVTGQVAVGDIEVQAGAVRVDGVTVQPGSPANAPLLTVTSTRKVVTVPAGLDAAASIERDDKVTVGLLDDRTVKAHVLSVGRDLAAPEGGDANGSPPKLIVTVTVDDPKTIAKLDSADVTVNFPGRAAKGVLAAPIEALVALTEGGYAVQAPAGLVAVHTGMFADGWVEISGAGLAPGTEVVVSS